MQKISSLKISVVAIASVVLMSSCSTYQNLVIQWKYRNDYKNPGVASTTPRVKTSENFVPSIEPSTSTNQESSTILLTSNESVSEVLEKMPEVVEVKKSFVKTSQINSASQKEEIKLSEKQAKAELKQIAKEIKKAEATKESQGGKSQLVAFLLAFFLGGLGIHRFYLGGKKNTTNGILQLIFTLLIVTSPITWVWSFIDWIRILIGTLKPGSGDYASKL